MVGDVLADRYELEELVGSGGMSSVFRAHDRVLERTVALKILHQRYNDEDEYVERFRREARMVAGLSHHNIVTVIDRGEHDGRQFIVFEYVDGENLKELVDREGPLPVERALELGIQIATALAFAHESGLVHRDVKPQNVLLNGDGEAKVTDFGIARSLDVGKGVTQTGHGARHLRLHRARAGAGPAGRRAHRRLLARRRALRAARPASCRSRATTSSRSRCSTSTRPRRACRRGGPTCRRGSTTRSRTRSRRSPTPGSRDGRLPPRARRRASPRCRPASRSRRRRTTARPRSCCRPAAEAAAPARGVARPLLLLLLGLALLARRRRGSASTTLARAGRRPARRRRRRRRRRPGRRLAPGRRRVRPATAATAGARRRGAAATDGNQATYWATENYDDPLAASASRASGSCSTRTARSARPCDGDDRHAGLHGADPGRRRARPARSTTSRARRRSARPTTSSSTARQRGTSSSGSRTSPRAGRRT